MIFYELCDKSNTVYTSTLNQCLELNLFIGKEKQNIRIGNVKNAFKRFSNGSVRLIIKDEKNLLVSTRILSSTLEIYSQNINILEKEREIQNEKYKILFHNLITTHAELQGEISSIISDKEIIECNSHQMQIASVKNNIEENIIPVSESILEILKRINDLQAQIEGFRILSGSQMRLDLGYHNIKKVLQQILYPFYPDLGKLNIYVNILINEEEAENLKLKIDYKIFNVAMHHFLNNVVKYTKPGSKIFINYDPLQKILDISMMSVKIEKEEILSIFDLGVSGKNSANLAGDGIGMFMVKKSLDLLGCKMEIIPKHSKSDIFNNIYYTENKFVLKFI